MKKFTLFFMSLFLAFGTTVAKDEENVEFALNYSTPENGAMVTSVDNIRMVFTKPITLTQSEVSIDVVNSQTNDVVKITSCSVSEWNDKEVLFRFEQIEVEGEKGKEYRDQYINALGSYTYTIPAGLIKSADGTEEFAGGTYTFSVVGTFELTDWSPRETTELNQIELTFDRPIIDVKLSPDLEFVKDWNYANPIISKVKEASVDGNKVTLTLETPITTPGSYDLNIKQGSFVSEGAINAYSNIYFTIIDPTPSFSTNYNDGDRVKELGNLEITFKNVTEFEMVEGKVITAVLPNKVEIAGEIEKQDNKFVVTFEEEFTEEGTYEFIIPAGAFTMDGVANEEGKSITVELYSFEIIPLEIESVTPEIVGEVDQIETIVITFNQIITLSQENWQQISQEITLTCGDEEYTLTYNPSSYSATNKLEYTVNAVWANNAYTCAEPVTIAGEYTLNLSDIVVDYAAEDVVDEWGWPAKVYHVKNHQLDGTYTWTVSGNAAAIENVPVLESKKVIYDLLGRRVESINGAGIYIVNGKKVVIK